MKNFNYYVPVNVVFGKGKLKDLGEYVNKYGRKAMLVTTGDFFKRTGLVDNIQSILKESNIESIWFGEVTPNPLAPEIDKGATLFTKEECSVVIGLGGGSAIDAAKGIAVAAGHRRAIWDFAVGCHDDAIDITDMTMPIIAITTTSGTGSHITPYSVVTNPETKQKPGLTSDYIYPKVALIDPELMLTVPSKITATTGFDVLAHAIEAYTSKDADPMTEMYCEESIRLVGKYLRKAVKDGSDFQARESLAWADTLSGFSIAVAGITLCHSIAHAVGGVCETVHGETLASMTPHTMRFSMQENEEKFKTIGKLLKYGNKEVEDSISLEETVLEVEKLISDIGLDISLGSQGVIEKDLENIAHGTLEYMAGGVDSDPKKAVAEDIINILKLSL